MNEEQIKFIRKISCDMQDFGILEPVADWIGCQFAFESNFGNSRIAKTRNNYCGMKCPMYRPTLDLAFTPNRFAKYKSLVDCEIDYVLWLAYNHFNRYDLSRIDLFSKLLVVKGYCPESDYIERINFVYQQFKNSTK